MIAEEQTLQNTKKVTDITWKAVAALSAALLDALMFSIRNHELNKGMGEVSMTQLLKSLNTDNGEILSYCTVPADVYQDMAATGVLKNAGIRNYSAVASQNGDSIMIFYGSNDQDKVDAALEAMDAMYGSKSKVNKDAFFDLTAEKDVVYIENITDEELELFKYFAELPGENLDFPNGMPYSVMEIGGEKVLFVLEEDVEKMNQNLSMVGATLGSEQGELVREQIAYRLKGRQERNIALDEAEKEQVIVDRANPGNSVHITAKDFTYYKNNKEVTKLSRTDTMDRERLDSIIDGFSDPVLVKRPNFSVLPFSEQKEYLQGDHDDIVAIPRDFDADLDIDMAQVREKLNQVEEINKYLSKFNSVSVKVDAKDIDKALNKLEKEKKRTEKEEKKERGSGR